MFIPVRTDCPLRSTPYVNSALILLNVFIYALQKLADGNALHFNHAQFALNPNDPHLINFVTYSFLHASWIHLLGNMLFLYIFGNNVSDKLGQWAYLLFYLGGAIFAGAGYVLLAPKDFSMAAPVVGASGAIAAVTGAYLVLFPRSNVTLFYFFILIGSFEVPGLLFVLFSFLSDVFYQVVGAGEAVAHSTHISGTLFGVAVALLLLALRLLDRDQWDLLALTNRWNRRRQYRAAVATGWNPYGTLPPPLPESSRRPPPPDPRESMVMDLRAQVAEAMAHRNLAAAADHYLRLRSIDPTQVLSRDAKLDIANQLAESGKFAHAAEAYDLFLQHYPQSEQHAHIELLSGLIYARYLDDPQRALTRLEHALPRLTTARDVELAKTEVERLRALPSMPG